MPMPPKIGYRCAVNVDALEGTPLVSNKQCAGLVQFHTRLGPTQGWRKGIEVKGNGDKIKKGTAIATFVNGIYESKPHDNHAAFYISQDKDGITVVDQWDGDSKHPNINKRTLPFLGFENDSVTYKNPSNNGDAFSVILLVDDVK